jgi:pimeloyl-ACP methyl ester carboxylesterase
MTIHEFGKENNDVLVMFHPLGVWWDVFEYVIPELEKDFHLIIPAIPGHDPDNPLRDFISIEETAEEITDWLNANGYAQVTCLYGCSMGGAVVMRMLAEGRIHSDAAVIDGGITPYRLPKPITYLIGIKDFLMTMTGKYMSIKALSSVFDPDKYSKEDMIYIKKVLRSMSARTIWRGFYSTNNYNMPTHPVLTGIHIEYWYGEDEKSARKWDIEYVRNMFPEVVFRENKGQDHAETFTLHPKEFCESIRSAIKKA